MAIPILMSPFTIEEPICFVESQNIIYFMCHLSLHTQRCHDVVFVLVTLQHYAWILVLKRVDFWTDSLWNLEGEVAWCNMMQLLTDTWLSLTVSVCIIIVSNIISDMFFRRACTKHAFHASDDRLPNRFGSSWSSCSLGLSAAQSGQGDAAKPGWLYTHEGVRHGERWLKINHEQWSESWKLCRL